jgi:hypothetical protein
MDQPTNPYGGPLEPERTPPPPAGEPGPMRRMSRVALGVGLAAFLGMAGAGVAFAVGGGSSSSTGSTGSSSSNGSATTPKGTAPAHPGRRFAGPAGHKMGVLGMGLGGGRVLYGQYTVEVPARASNGSTSAPTYKTIDVQVGTASVSGNSITVTSAGGHAQTYSVVSSTIVDSQANGISTIANGDTVRIEGLVQSGGVEAMNIVDMTKIGASRQGFGFGRPGGPPGGGAPPAAASSFSPA